MKRIIISIIVIVLLCLVGWKVYQKVTEPAKGPKRRPGSIPVAVKVEPVRKTTVHDIGYFTGTLHPLSQFIVAPKIGGRLEKIFVNIGDRVKRNQLVALLDDDEYLQQVDQAKAELEVARAKIEETLSSREVARRELERIRSLRQKNIASQSSFDTAEAQFNAQSAMHKVALAQAEQKLAALKAAQVRLSYTKIHASWENGGERRVAGERFVDEGAMLAPNASIVSILENSVLTAVIYVIEQDYPKVRVGQEAVITTDAYPLKKFFGKIVRIAPLLKETSRQARIEIDIPNGENFLRPGMFARIQIVFDSHDDTTVIPISAIVRRNGSKGVFKVDPEAGNASFVPVTLGIVNRELAEVITPPSLSGLVVTLGQHLLEDGSSIVLPGTGSSTGPSMKDKKRRPVKGGRPPAGGRP